jgi:hypothetical protein
MIKSKFLISHHNILRFWSFEDEYEPWNQIDMPLVLPSDSYKRIDLKNIEDLDFETAQKNKEKLENIQRNDKKLRDSRIK